jgi:hypothetical protein
MKKALIDPNAKVMHITEWVLNPATDKYDPVITEIPNSDRVAEVAEAFFPVALPLFWVDCDDDVVADMWYYNNVTNQIVLIPPPPPKPT